MIETLCHWRIFQICIVKFHTISDKSMADARTGGGSHTETMERHPMGVGETTLKASQYVSTVSLPSSSLRSISDS
jgi:hypothetical protein